MHRVQRYTLLGSVAALSVVACAEPVVPGSALRLADLKPSFTLEEEIAAGQALQTSVNGPNKVRTASTVTYRADVQGASGPFYYYWLSEVCPVNQECTGSTIFNEGWGLSSVTFGVRAEWTAYIITVEVRDYPEGGRSGESDIQAIGPALYPSGSPFKCRINNTWFPFTDGWPVAEGEDSYTVYNRNPCDGSRNEKTCTPDQSVFDCGMTPKPPPDSASTWP